MILGGIILGSQSHNLGIAGVLRMYNHLLVCTIIICGSGMSFSGEQSFLFQGVSAWVELVR